MPGARVENSPSFVNRKRDIASWQEGNISALRSREKKRYLKRKSAIKEYFTTDGSPEEIALQHHISTEDLLELAEKCTMQHWDGKEWGFRALVPRVKVVDYAVPPAAEDTEKQDVESRCPDAESQLAQEDRPGAFEESSKEPSAGESSILIDEAVEDEENDTSKHEAINLSSQHAIFAMDVPETPFPVFTDGEEEETQGPTEKLAERVVVEEIPAEDTLEPPVIAEDTSDQQQSAASESEADEPPDIMAEAPALEDLIFVSANETVDQEAQDENAEAERTFVERRDVPKEDEDTTEAGIEEAEERFALDSFYVRIFGLEF
ncbi:MAG: hypothetical protein ACJ795_10775, partial [Ktedonobacteraceae bacterium]